jgi:carbonic anhydrase/acetyltransferase-like protein (isoleucine patch superfamily)
MPQKGHGAFIAPNANVMGDVKLGSNTSIWYGACLRGGFAGEVGAMHAGKHLHRQLMLPSRC